MIVDLDKPSYMLERGHAQERVAIRFIQARHDLDRPSRSRPGTRMPGRPPRPLPASLKRWGESQLTPSSRKHLPSGSSHDRPARRQDQQGLAWRPRALWDAVDLPHLRAFIIAMLATAARPKAVLELTRFQCDVKRCQVDTMRGVSPWAPQPTCDVSLACWTRSRASSPPSMPSAPLWIQRMSRVLLTRPLNHP